MENAKKIYFISDAHLGCRALSKDYRKLQEKKLVDFLYSIKDDASELYMMGDMFDFWFEYPTVVPKGYVRFLGALAALTDHGVKVHFLIGNHDIWCQDYLEEECGVILHKQSMELTLGSHWFFLAHGDGLGDPNWKFQILRNFFHNRFCQWLFSWLHPTIGVEFGMNWAKHSRLKHEPALGNAPAAHGGYLGEDKEFLVIFAKKYLKTHPDVNFLIFGHRHLELDLVLSRSARVIILGDWVTQFTYAVYDGVNLSLEHYGDLEHPLF